MHDRGIRPVRILVATTLLLGVAIGLGLFVALSAALDSPRPYEPDPHIANRAEQSAILRGVAGRMLPTHLQQEKHLIVLEGAALSLCVGARKETDSKDLSCTASSIINSAHIDLRIPATLRADLVQVSRIPQPFVDPEDARFLVKTQDQLTELFANGDGWTTFYGEYPASIGVLRTTRAVVTPQRDRALILVHHQFGGLGGTGLLLLLDLKEHGWTVVDEGLVWIS